ncbi:MAG: hypothetical protein KC620_11620, partial [Myxococcales bacterium]|nr:hypothetical protein [Myxococcales bacterium]
AADGRRVALIGQGFMPAEDFHVLRSAAPAALDDVWFLLPAAEGDTLLTPAWPVPFQPAQARRLRDP